MASGFAREHPIHLQSSSSLHRDMFGNLFIKARGKEDLCTFAEGAFNVLKISSPIIRESDSYVDGQYIVGRALGMVVKLALTDDDDLQDYKFLMNFKADGVWIDDGTVFEGVADLVARKLALEGYEVARVPDFGKLRAFKLVYSRKSADDDGARNQIEVKRNG